MSKTTQIIASVATAAVLTGFTATGYATTLAPHQAEYGLSLKQAEASSSINDATGTIQYRFEKTCDGYISENRTFLSIRDETGNVFHTGNLYITWKSLDGKDYRFRIRNMRDGQTTDESVGYARSGPAPEAVFTSPAQLTMPLPDYVVFPTRHVKMLLEAAEKGQKVFSVPVFDGAIEHPTNTVSAFINTKKLAEGTEDGLAHDPFWPMRLAFFPIPDESEQPIFEMSIDYSTSGFARELVQDYGDFELIGKLREVENLPQPDCGIQV